MERYVKSYATWAELVTQAETGASSIPDGDRASRDKKDAREYKRFTGAENFAEAVKLAREGWADGEAEIKEMSAPLFNHVSAMIERVDVSHDIEGHAIDVSRFVDGEPECWLKFEEVKVNAENGRRLVRVVFNCCASAGISTEIIRRKGATIAALVELLEFAGHRVEVSVVFSVGSTGARKSEKGTVFEIGAVVKTFDQPLDAAIMAYALLHPSVLRSLMFSLMEQAPEHLRRKMGVPDGSYGTVKEIQTLDRGDVYIPSMFLDDAQWESAERAEAWLIKQLETLGIKLDKTRQ
jgi:hypothetical protein